MENTESVISTILGSSALTLIVQYVLDKHSKKDKRQQAATIKAIKTIDNCKDIALRTWGTPKADRVDDRRNALLADQYPIELLNHVITLYKIYPKLEKAASELLGDIFYHVGVYKSETEQDSETYKKIYRCCCELERIITEMSLEK